MNGAAFGTGLSNDFSQGHQTASFGKHLFGGGNSADILVTECHLEFS